LPSLKVRAHARVSASLPLPSQFATPGQIGLSSHCDSRREVSLAYPGLTSYEKNRE
jgi:hypothetical protein